MNKIDFVCLWVNGDDPKWIEKKNKYLKTISNLQDIKEEDIDSRRFREQIPFKYWLRSVEYNTPWVNKIYLITDEQIPEGVNPNAEKLVIVDHRDILPAEALPCFNSTTIESFVYKIKDLSENFVYFNDDLFVNKPIEQSFFFKNGLPCYWVRFCKIYPYYKQTIDYHQYNNTCYINRNFTIKQISKIILTKCLRPCLGVRAIVSNLIHLLTMDPGMIEENHLPTPMLKSTYEAFFQKHPEVLEEMVSAHIRNNSCINQWLFKRWNIASGKFNPCPQRGFYYHLDNLSHDKLWKKDITEGINPLICINDKKLSDERNNEVIKKLSEAFAQRYPQKSSFEY